MNQGQIFTQMGTIEKVFFKALPAPDAYDNNYRMSIFVKHDDGTESWYSVGQTKGESWNVKVGTGFKEAGAGSKIVVKYTTDPTGKYRNTKKSDVMFIELVEPSAAPRQAPQGAGQRQPAAASAPAQSQAYQKRDNTGVATGHALNCAVYALGTGKVHGTEQLLAEARRWHALTEVLNAWAVGEFAEYSTYDREASAGQAIKAASEAGAGLTDAEIIQYAREIMLAAAKLKAEIKDGNISVTLNLETKPAGTKVTKPKASKPAPAPASDFDDSDIPF